MKEIDILSFINMLKRATEFFLSKVEEINAINYFPVVDHDTGANMYATLKDALTQSKGDAKLLVNKLIVCSKGNSGIILAKAVSGFLTVMLEKNGLKCGDDLCCAVVSARDNAYDAVLCPKEGTMLTFLDVLSLNSDWENLVHISAVLGEALEKTLVDGEYDAGAKGMYYLIEFAFSLGLDTNIAIRSKREMNISSSLKYKYCTEFVVECECDSKMLKAFISQINSLGDSIAYSYAESVLKVHIHNNNPFEIFALANNFGQFLYKKIDNMSLENGEQHLVVFVVDDNGDLFSPFARFNVEYISLVSPKSDRELSHKMSTICADTVILLTNTPERYNNERYDHLIVIKTYGLLSKVSAMFCEFNTKLNEYIENVQAFACIYQDRLMGENDASGERNLTDAQKKDLFSFPM
jgi:Predicted kinase related to dihydroxyacetone kinase